MLHNVCVMYCTLFLLFICFLFSFCRRFVVQRSRSSAATSPQPQHRTGNFEESTARESADAEQTTSATASGKYNKLPFILNLK